MDSFFIFFIYQNSAKFPDSNTASAQIRPTSGISIFLNINKNILF